MCALRIRNTVVSALLSWSGNTTNVTAKEVAALAKHLIRRVYQIKNTESNNISINVTHSPLDIVATVLPVEGRYRGYCHHHHKYQHPINRRTRRGYHILTKSAYRSKDQNEYK